MHVAEGLDLHRVRESTKVSSSALRGALSFVVPGKAGHGQVRYGGEESSGEWKHKGKSLRRKVIIEFYGIPSFHVSPWLSPFPHNYCHYLHNDSDSDNDNVACSGSAISDFYPITLGIDCSLLLKSNFQVHGQV